ncbi:putative lipid-transfer protein DIR1 [Aegilops tauschii subsp. strangulata]|uniref:Bifunctional inhibitor/plant lipid transfer protein/seed storage helical domain-containing protein n=5 Tax=Triticinae TaxID=1648030 RepID=A0A453GA50_AEGTS|nr:male-cone protein 1 [Aegilops tauschii subsp. strangulata]XP_044353811.1 male-cone protein 1-like [Triticum aestivum]
MAMAGRKVTTSNAGVAAALVALLVVAAASGAAGYHVCNVDTDSLVNNCRSYCAVGSNEASPSGACCGAVRGANFKCLCKYKGLLPKGIDANRAMQIPAKCGYGAASC